MVVWCSLVPKLFKLLEMILQELAVFPTELPPVMLLPRLLSWRSHWNDMQGGSVAHLHRLLSIAAGAQVLYVGDHIYGDILRSKKELGMS
jgi:hypothetical protein